MSYGPMLPNGADKLITLGLVCLAVIVLALAGAIIYGVLFLPSPWNWAILSVVVGAIIGSVFAGWWNGE